MFSRFRKPAVDASTVDDRTDGELLDRYVDGFPAPQTAVDIFAGSWSSLFPAPFDDLEAGPVELFNDQRIQWMLDQIGGVSGQRVLELGPLEGGHTYMLDRAGADEVVAIESNTQAYLKCLIAKEIVGMPASRFLCGDFVEYLAEAVTASNRFDLIVASGVLYHLIDPVATIVHSAAITDQLFLWTHYYDAAILASQPHTAGRLTTAETVTTAGFEHHRYRQEYGRGVEDDSFCGGSRPYANWLDRESLFGALEHVGFDRTDVAFEDLDHPQGPSLCVLARKDRAG